MPVTTRYSPQRSHKLPNEVWWMIISRITSVTDLKNATLVDKTWLEYCRKRLWRVPMLKRDMTLDDFQGLTHLPIQYLRYLPFDDFDTADQIVECLSQMKQLRTINLADGDMISRMFHPRTRKMDTTIQRFLSLPISMEVILSKPGSFLMDNDLLTKSRPQGTNLNITIYTTSQTFRDWKQELKTVTHPSVSIQLVCTLHTDIIPSSHTRGGVSGEITMTKSMFETIRASERVTGFYVDPYDPRRKQYTNGGVYGNQTVPFKLLPIPPPVDRSTGEEFPRRVAMYMYLYQCRQCQCHDPRCMKEGHDLIHHQPQQQQLYQQQQMPQQQMPAQNPNAPVEDEVEVGDDDVFEDEDGMELDQDEQQLLMQQRHYQHQRYQNYIQYYQQQPQVFFPPQMQQQQLPNQQPNFNQQQQQQQQQHQQIYQPPQYDLMRAQDQYQREMFMQNQQRAQVQGPQQVNNEGRPQQQIDPRLQEVERELIERDDARLQPFPHQRLHHLPQQQLQHQVQEQLHQIRHQHQQPNVPHQPMIHANNRLQPHAQQQQDQANLIPNNFNGHHIPVVAPVAPSGQVAEQSPAGNAEQHPEVPGFYQQAVAGLRGMPWFEQFQGLERNPEWEVAQRRMLMNERTVQQAVRNAQQYAAAVAAARATNSQQQSQQQPQNDDGQQNTAQQHDNTQQNTTQDTNTQHQEPTKQQEEKKQQQEPTQSQDDAEDVPTQQQQNNRLQAEQQNSLQYRRMQTRRQENEDIDMTATKSSRQQQLAPKQESNSKVL